MGTTLDGITVGGRPVEAFLIEERDLEVRLSRLQDLLREKAVLRGHRGKLRGESYRERSGRTRRLRRSEINANYWRTIMAKRSGAPTGQKLLACLLNGESWTYKDFAEVFAEDGATLGSGLFSQTIRQMTQRLKPLLIRDTSAQPHKYYLRREALEMTLDDLEAVRKGRPLPELGEKYPELLRGLKFDENNPGSGKTATTGKKSNLDDHASPQGVFQIPSEINVNVTIRFMVDLAN